ncbi:hypothetical protein LCGC14_2211980 [marine sediment metagenome]|uniref:BRCT domain-containing protein n=1 Tax=marine sediment metagenome TaxID=412755 RepID=A0A0F9E129_9ZZZZ
MGLNVVGKSQNGVYLLLSSGRVAYVSYEDIQDHETMAKAKSAFEDVWPDMWDFIKIMLPDPYFLPITNRGFGPSDLYYLTTLDFQLRGHSKEMGDKLIQSIHKSKTRPLVNLIYGLGIRHIGLGSAKLLTKHFNSLHSLGRASISDLFLIDRLGPTRVHSLRVWFQSEINWRTIERMRFAGVQTFIPLPDEEKEVSPIQGKVFMFTGRLTLFTRDKAQALVESRGGVAGSSVSKNTNFLVVGEKPGSKLGHAAMLGIKTISEREFLEVVK